MGEGNVSNASIILNLTKVENNVDGEQFSKSNTPKSNYVQQERKPLQHSLLINRRCFTKSSFEIATSFVHKSPTRRQVFTKLLKSCCPKSSNVWKEKIFSLFPIISILKLYGRKDFFCDVVSGLTVGVMHIPQGMAYGILANIDPVYGLYTSFFPVFLYFLFGTSRHISIGVFAVVSLMIGSVVDRVDCNSFLPEQLSFNRSSALLPMKNLSSDITYENVSISASSIFNNSSNKVENVTENVDLEMCKVQHALTLTFIVGVYQLLMGLFHFGFLTVYLSDPLTRGLTTGAGVHVFTSQIKHVFGISTGKFTGPLKLVFLYKTFFEKIVDTNMAPLITSLICILIIYSLQKWVSPRMRKAIKIPLPAELIVLIFGTLISHYCKFSSPQVFNMKVVGKIPQGIPLPKPPNLLLIPQVALDALAIAVVSFTINISMAKMFSSKHGYNLDSNQELIAYGISNIVCCNLNSYVSTASLSRSLVQESTGGKTQVAGLVSSSLLLVVLLFIGPLFHDLPNCILAAVIIVNLRGIFLQVCDLKYLSRISRADMFTWLVTCLGVVLTDVDFGLLVGLAFSFLTIVLRNQITKLQSLGNIPGTELYEDVLDYHEAKEINGIRIFRFKNSLFFANAEYFQASMEQHMKKYVTKKPVHISNELCHTTLKDSKVFCCVGRKGKKMIKIHEDEDSAKNLNLPANRMQSENASDQLVSSDVNVCDSSNVPISAHSDNTVQKLVDDGDNQDINDKVDVQNENGCDVKDVIIDCGSMTFIDTVGIATLNLITDELFKKNICLTLTRCSDDVNATLRMAMEMKKLKNIPIFVTTHDAVVYILNSKHRKTSSYSQ